MFPLNSVQFKQHLQSISYSQMETLVLDNVEMNKLFSQEKMISGL